MAVDETLVNQIRELLEDQPIVEEKKMFQGVCFMVNDKMLVCAGKDELLCRIGFAQAQTELAYGRCRPMMMNGRTSKDFVYVDVSNLKNPYGLKYWVDLSLQFNSEAKASKKRKPKA